MASARMDRVATLRQTTKIIGSSTESVSKPKRPRHGAEEASSNPNRLRRAGTLFTLCVDERNYLPFISKE